MFPAVQIRNVKMIFELNYEWESLDREIWVREPNDFHTTVAESRERPLSATLRRDSPKSQLISAIADLRL